MLAQKLMLVGIAIIFIGIILLVISSLLSIQEKGKTKTEVAVGGFIGIFPFGFFTSKKAFWMWIVLAAVAIIFWIIARKLL